MIMLMDWIIKSSPAFNNCSFEINHFHTKLYQREENYEQHFSVEWIGRWLTQYVLHADNHKYVCWEKPPFFQWPQIKSIDTKAMLAMHSLYYWHSCQ